MLGEESIMGDAEISRAHQLPVLPPMEQVCAALRLAPDEVSDTVIPGHGDKIGSAFPNGVVRLRPNFLEEHVAAARPVSHHLAFWSAFMCSEYVTARLHMFKSLPEVPPLTWRSRWNSSRTTTEEVSDQDIHPRLSGLNHGICV